MFAVIRKNYLHLENLKNATPDCKERGFDFACSDEIRLLRKAVMRNVGLSE